MTVDVPPVVPDNRKNDDKVVMLVLLSNGAQLHFFYPKELADFRTDWGQSVSARSQNCVFSQCTGKDVRCYGVEEDLANLAW